MARVLIPQNARTYNYNPTGSSTTTVTMKANNPFDGARGQRMLLAGARNGGAIPGMGALPRARRVTVLAGMGTFLGDDTTDAAPAAPAADASAAPAAPAAAPASTGSTIDYTKILSAAVPAITAAATPLIQNLVGGKSTPVTAAATQVLQVASQPRVVAAPKPASKLPLIIGGVAVLGLVAFLFLRKKG